MDSQSTRSSFNPQNFPQLPKMEQVWEQTLGWQPTTVQQQQFQQLYEKILEGNQRLNLTRITEPEDFWEKHLWDSLRGIIAPSCGMGTPSSENNPELPPNALKVIDIGTGAGFPGNAIAIAFPDFSVTLLDATRKKIAFLDTLLAEMGLNNAKTLTGRAEQINQHPHHRQSYDIACLRAVAPAPACAEYSLPLLKTGGVAILYRGHWTEEETAALQEVVEPLGGVVESVESFTTPLSNSVRHCLYLRKASP
jgi:16S rRNA (guanine527-N7)-methyltransferase